MTERYKCILCGAVWESFDRHCSECGVDESSIMGIERAIDKAVQRERKEIEGVGDVLVEGFTDSSVIECVYYKGVKDYQDAIKARGGEMKCPKCEASKNVRLCDVKGFEFYHCTGCSHEWLKPEPDHD